MRIALALIAMLALADTGVAAQEVEGELDPDRYIVRDLEDGVLRIDRETGATSICREDADGWACRAVADDREALEDEIARLAEENQTLRLRIDELEERMADADVAEPDVAERRDRDLDLPTDSEIDQVMDTFERMMRRFLGIVRSLKDDFEEERL